MKFQELKLSKYRKTLLPTILLNTVPEGLREVAAVDPDSSRRSTIMSLPGQAGDYIGKGKDEHTKQSSGAKDMYFRRDCRSAAKERVKCNALDKL